MTCSKRPKSIAVKKDLVGKAAKDDHQINSCGKSSKYKRDCRPGRSHLQQELHVRGMRWGLKQIHPGICLVCRLKKKEESLAWADPYWITLSENGESVWRTFLKFWFSWPIQRSPLSIKVYVVVQFYPWFKFYFPLFQNRYHTLPYPKTKENKF